MEVIPNALASEGGFVDEGQPLELGNLDRVDRSAAAFRSAAVLHVSPSVLAPRLVTVGFSVMLLVSIFLMALRLTPTLSSQTARMAERSRSAAVLFLCRFGTWIGNRKRQKAAALQDAGAQAETQGNSRREEHCISATIAAVLLIASHGFVELSSSCMMEISALAPIVAALAVLWTSRRGQGGTGNVRVAVACALFGVGLSMKLIGIIYLPLH